MNFSPETFMRIDLKRFGFMTVFVIVIFFCNPALANKGPYDWALVELDYICRERVSNLRQFTGKMHDLARRSATDESVILFFEMNRQFFNTCKSQTPPDAMRGDVENLREHFSHYYLSNYYAFYDMLFIDLNGDVFYTIRKEVDSIINPMGSKGGLGSLEEAISKKPENELFIDFYQYMPSSEPAAFFVEPVIKNGVHVGWLALQCAINKLNSIFAATDDLGQTGETFLVNSSGLMLTESYFKGYSTILKEHLDDRNIQPKFQERKGHRRVIDYRGNAALSSFEVFDFLGTKWLVVAKIDKDEITTNHYKRHSNYYNDRLKAHLRNSVKPSKEVPIPAGRKKSLRVDMDEFMKADQGEVLETWGVSTCTALIAYIPGKFGYLAHISSKDKVYGNNETNLVSQITKKINSFDIYPSEKQKVTFIIISPHLDTLSTITAQLISDGFSLSQVHVMSKENAGTASIVFNYSENTLSVKWQMNDGTDILNAIDDSVNLCSSMEAIMMSDSQEN